MNGKTVRTLIGACALATLLPFGQASAAEGGIREAGDWRIKAGATLVDPNDDSSAVSANGTPVPGTGVGVDEAWALGLIVNYAITPTFAMELLASTPFEHDVTAQGLDGLGINDIGSVEHLPPTLTAQWYPLGASNSRWQPYVGLGVNYWLVLDEELDSDVTDALGPASFDVDDSWGLAGQAGVDVALGGGWEASLAAWYISIETEAEITTETPGFEQLNVDVDIDPWVFFFGLSYRF